MSRLKMRELNSYLKKEGDHTYYYDDDGCEYDNLQSFLQTGILGFCGCGCPESNLLLIHDFLSLNESHRNQYRDFYSDIKDFNKLYNKQKEEIKEFVCKNWEEFAQFFWYAMDDKKITEHGTSIPGWINDDNFLKALQEWRKSYTEESK